MSLNRDQEEALRLHNEARDEIREDPRPHLRWDTALEAEAYQHAKYLAQIDNLQHASQRTHGENLSRGYPSVSLAQGSYSWIKEKYDYEGEKIGSWGNGKGQTGHYTQLIWPQCTRVGIASARSRSGKDYVVARYDAIQLAGQTPYNRAKGNIFRNRTWKKINFRDGGLGNSPIHAIIQRFIPGRDRGQDRRPRANLDYGQGRPDQYQRPGHSSDYGWGRPYQNQSPRPDSDYAYGRPYIRVIEPREILRETKAISRELWDDYQRKRR